MQRGWFAPSLFGCLCAEHISNQDVSRNFERGVVCVIKCVIMCRALAIMKRGRGVCYMCLIQDVYCGALAIMEKGA